MEVFKYYHPQIEVYGYNPNDVLYVDPDIVCKKVVGVNCEDLSNLTETQIHDCELCKNQTLLKEATLPRAENGRRIDTSNLYIRQIVHMSNLVVGCMVLGVFIYNIVK